jgi:hypothetical protein
MYLKMERCYLFLAKNVGVLFVAVDITITLKLSKSDMTSTLVYY